MNLFATELSYGFPEHSYTLNATGIKMKERVFSNRYDANKAMYNFMGKHNLCLEKVYDDKHCKTYVCNNGVRFYVCRTD